ncbi:cation diffusion facilitator family transporter [Nitratireductor sp. GCM10026969]|uniref:cation diffusion facilitator family transporter n=1 Tax=Nitratireductor sp. GCM10026969 TaxID=3252645 RepID=UPI00361F77E3
MSHSRSNATDRSSSDRGRRLLIALALNLAITLAEFVGGLVSGSLALMADAAHNLSDAGSVLVSYIAWRISLRRADRLRTFGYARAETVGALINLTVLIVIGLYLLYEAAHRLFDPGAVAGGVMLAVGVIALVEDAAAAWVLRTETGSLNVRSTFLHMVADALATLGVIGGALAIMAWGPAAHWVDPAVTALISGYIFFHGSREIRKAIAVLMESAPKDFDYAALLRELQAAPGVAQVHHLHVWEATPGQTAIEVHLAFSERDLGVVTRTKEHLKAILHERHNIAHATIEVELAGRTGHDGKLIRNE